MMNRVDKWIWTAQWKAKNLVKDFFYNEEGDVNIVSMVVLIGIAVLLAVIFKNNIKDLLDVLFKAISGNAVKYQTRDWNDSGLWERK